MNPRAELFACFVLFACSRSPRAGSVDPSASHAPALAATEEASMSAIKLSSSAFTQGGKLPRACGCEGGDRSPPLVWEGVPAGAKSLALIVTDPDAPDPAAPKTVWAHWLVYNLPADLRALSEGAALPPAAHAGKNDWGTPGYRGPCPPIGRHRYFFKLYALDTQLADLGSPTRLELEAALKGHVLAQGELMGTYQKGD